MRIVSVRLRNFRCFSALDLDFESPVVLIHGPNGSGKTSILEALHYACYLRSFKTHLPKELVKADAEGFGVTLNLAGQAFDTLQVQLKKKKRMVKLNEQGLSSYKELYDTYRAITITEDDLLMIQGAPSLRRSFLDQMVLLIDPNHALLAKKYRSILENRNALISRGHPADDSYMLWTDQLLLTARQMQSARKNALARLEEKAQILVNDVLKTSLKTDVPLVINYTYARPYTSIEDITSAQQLFNRYPRLRQHELVMRRSLFGAHLDDFSVTYLGKSCRTYSSRGQQKLVVFLLKLAQLQSMHSQGVRGAILLVDDFMTDFDEERAAALISLMTEHASQVILTSPIENLVKNKLPADITQSIHLA